MKCIGCSWKSNILWMYRHRHKTTHIRMLRIIIKHTSSRRLHSLISVSVSLVFLLLLFFCSPKNIHIMNINRRFCVMINFHVTKLAKGRHKNICEWIYIHSIYIMYTLHWTCALPFMFHFILFSEAIFFHTFGYHLLLQHIFINHLTRWLWPQPMSVERVYF